MIICALITLICTWLQKLEVYFSRADVAVEPCRLTVRTNLTPFLPIGGGNRLIDSFSRIYSTTYDEADGKLGPSLSQHCHVTELCRHFRFSPDTKDTARIASLFHPKRSKYDQNKQYVCSDFICRQKKQSDWSDCSACEKVFEKYFHFRETKVPYLKSSL